MGDCRELPGLVRVVTICLGDLCGFLVVLRACGSTACALHSCAVLQLGDGFVSAATRNHGSNGQTGALRDVTPEYGSGLRRCGALLRLDGRGRPSLHQDRISFR